MVRLGGVEYGLAAEGPYSLAYDLFMQQVVADAGLLDVFARSRPELELSETDRLALAQDALRALTRSGQVTVLLAGLLKPVDAPWSIAWALATAKVLDGLQDPADHAAISELLFSGLASFFLAGPRSLPISP